MDEKGLKDFLRRSAEEAWERSGEPYLLSFVSNDLSRQGEEYHSALSENERLKSFAARAQEEEGLFKVVQHPVHKAKVGIIPFDKEFAFPAEAERKIKDGSSRRTEGEQRIVDFLHILSRVPDDILDETIIPAKALVFILRDK